MPHMEHLHQVLKENPNLQIIGVNVMDRKSPENLKEFLKNRPTPLTYTMAVDVDGKRTKAKWLDPLEVNGIPHVFAIKNGKLIWQGTSLKAFGRNADGYVEAGLLSGLPCRSKQRMRETRKTRFSCRRGRWSTSLSKKWQTGSCSPLKQIQESNQFSQDRLIYLKTIPFNVLLQQGKYDEAQLVLNDLTEEYSDNYRVQINVAGSLLQADTMPSDKLDAALVERCLRRCIEISKKGNKGGISSVAHDGGITGKAGQEKGGSGVWKSHYAFIFGKSMGKVAGTDGR